MSIINSQPLIGASGQGGYFLSKSLRFRSSASAYLNRTPASAGNRRTWTWSGWVKRGALGANAPIFQSGHPTSPWFLAQFETDNTFQVSFSAGVSGGTYTTQVFRDSSAWYHIVIAVDTTQATASNRLKLYVNGSQITAFSSTNYPALNFDTQVNNTISHTIGAFSTNAFDGYLTEVNFIDGQALTPSSFGETSTSTGVWIPKKYTGTYGTNGFYLPFTNTTSTTTLGNDFSGNSNTWTVNNISLTSGSTYDSMKDVPTLTDTDTANYAVMNPLNSASSMTPSGGNLNVVTSGVSVSSVSTISVNSGKWYCEITIASVADSTMVGITSSGRSYQSGAFYNTSNSVGYYFDGTKFVNTVQTSYGASYTTGDVIGIALDIDAGTVTFYKNNTSQGTAASGLTGGYYFAVADASSGSNTSYNVNFGQRPFTYTPPSGFVALNTFNLPTPTIGATASTVANKYFNATTYTGNGTGLGSTQTISNGNFQPDFIWIKSRNTADYHNLNDSVRGIVSTGSPNLFTNTTDAETTYTGYGISALTSTGFTLIGNGTYTNANTYPFVAWQWKANGSGSTNTAGSITSTVSANTTAGFSIVTYTGNGTIGATIGHGLGVAPSMLIVKQRTGGLESWQVYHSTLGATQYLQLNSTGAAASNINRWNNTAPTSTVFTVYNDTINNGNTNTYVAYCFAQIAGYSAFGSYTGNGSTDGTFVYTGFRPRFVLVKESSASGNNWVIYDTARDTYNECSKILYPNLSNAEFDGSTVNLDILSNGFKPRDNWGGNNNSGSTYIYAAFAESPFKFSNAR